ncbi:MAG: alpha/beta fold hydrolase [Leptolyngbyaceae cyanobacterium MO_188.B28]|nr:alpha/beta fold hydrolase [Leptolyngbyaceae cyanobacterium MO_188.B28]
MVKAASTSIESARKLPYDKVTKAITRDVGIREEALPLFDPACGSRFFLHPHLTPKVCLFFHGFTAGPYQFVPLGERLFKAGYNVLIPLMPGHGKAGNWSKDNPPPLPTDAKDYLKYALQWLKIARMLGDKAVVGGLSGGGTLAGWLALEQANNIDRAILFAPYLSSSNRVIDLFVKTFDDYFEWSKLSGPSYQGFPLAALRAILTIGQFNLKRARKGPVAPMFIISSESDKAVSNSDHHRLFELALEHQPKCWYNRFDRVLDIPHTMMTESEGNKFQNLLNVMAKAYIESDLTWSEVEEIAYRMTKRKTFKSVVAELNLQDKVSRDMPAMMTMVDKWSIVVSRELDGRRVGRSRRRRQRPRDR